MQPEAYLLFSGKNAAIRSFSVNSIPRLGYCRSTRSFISAASLEAATLVSQSEMYFFINEMAERSCLAPGPSWPGIRIAGCSAEIWSRVFIQSWAALVFGNAEVDLVEDRIAGDDGFERRNVDETVAGAVALDATGDGELLALQRQHRARKFLGQDRIGSWNVVAVSREPEFLARGPGILRRIDGGRKGDDLRCWKSLV